jgi:outer membrane lipoprotein-sorting protein
MSGQELAKRIKDAYASVKSYSGTTRASTSMAFNGSPSKMDSSATIQYARPGKFRVDGMLMMSTQKFAIVSDGSQTWMSSIRDSEIWEKAEGIEMAIASFTGVSGGAVTTIPAILTDGSWGNVTGRIAGAKVSRETLDGRSVYRAETSDELGAQTVWIDAETYLLVKLVQKHNVSKIGSALPEANAQQLSGIEDYVVTETFTEVKTNHQIPDETFARPKGAPP